MVTPPKELSALFARFTSEFSAKFTTLFVPLVTLQAVAVGSLRALITAAVLVSRLAVGNGASEKGELGRPLRKAHRVVGPVERRPGGVLCMEKGQGAAGRWPPVDLHVQTK